MSAALHELTYAYPTSPAAQAMGWSSTGCYVLAANGRSRSFESLAIGMQCTVALGTSPARWSIDHPLNQHFIADFKFGLEPTNGHVA